jgi:hypothetical protein
LAMINRPVHCEPKETFERAFGFGDGLRSGHGGTVGKVLDYVKVPLGGPTCARLTKWQLTLKHLKACPQRPASSSPR